MANVISTNIIEHLEFYKSRNGILFLQSKSSSHCSGATHRSNRANFSSSSATLASRSPVVSTEIEYRMIFDLKHSALVKKIAGEYLFENFIYRELQGTQYFFPHSNTKFHHQIHYSHLVYQCIRHKLDPCSIVLHNTMVSSTALQSIHLHSYNHKFPLCLCFQLDKR